MHKMSKEVACLTPVINMQNSDSTEHKTSIKNLQIWILQTFYCKAGEALNKTLIGLLLLYQAVGVLTASTITKCCNRLLT